jgi:hypothetical protein
MESKPEDRTKKQKKKNTSVSLTASSHGSGHLINNSSFWDISVTT